MTEKDSSHVIHVVSKLKGVSRYNSIELIIVKSKLEDLRTRSKGAKGTILI